MFSDYLHLSWIPSNPEEEDHSWVHRGRFLTWLCLHEGLDSQNTRAFLGVGLASLCSGIVSFTFARARGFCFMSCVQNVEPCSRKGSKVN